MPSAPCLVPMIMVIFTDASVRSAKIALYPGRIFVSQAFRNDVTPME